MKSVLFYSFKGGVGRTQSMLNIAKYLASEHNKKIALLDFDIYAPGLTYLAKFNEEKEGKSYLLSFLLNSFNGKKSNLYYEKLDSNLYLFPSFNIDNLQLYHHTLTELSQYLYSIKISAESRINTVSTATDDVFNLIMKSIEDISECDFDYVFLDARTGITEISDILFSNFVDLKVILSSYNKQNIKGTTDILKLISEQKGKKHKILRILSPKPKENRNIYKEIRYEADLNDNLELKNKFDWYGTYEISYEEDVVSNDIDLWERLSEDSLYRKELITISNKINDLFSNKSKITEILLRKVNDN